MVAVCSAQTLNCIKYQSEYSIWLTSKRIAEETNADIKCPAKGPSGTIFAPVPDASVTNSATVSFSWIKMNIVSVKLESESDDLRSSEKEDTDLGEV